MSFQHSSDPYFPDISGFNESKCLAMPTLDLIFSNS
uniref:Uncharacterized protein n=1 Tax=Lotus japonicus TaxID=34305 RepID=I3S7U2_LOTJA|nr:unknown [Lotus japonicus]